MCSMRLNLSGQKFGMLTAEKFSCRKGSVSYWICVCECGQKHEVSITNLKSGDIKSCGCLRRLTAKKQKHKHGRRKTAEYTSWAGVKSRCFNQKEKAYPNYGGRGITVCERWRNSFENFLADMGPRPSQKHSVDRIDVNGNYEPSNCRWATATQQARNRNVYKNSISGCTGVIFNPVVKKWQSQIKVNKKNIVLGYFDTLHNAIATRWVAEATYWK
jgi:hypothetical protein